VSLPTQAHPATGPDESKPPEADARSLVERLKTDGHAVLVDVRFESGSADLSAGPTPSLDAIAGYLSANPAATILIVGHTDASGGLQSNLSLSRMRAQAVVERLVRDMAADPERIMAEGAGPLAPIATNLTEEGRQKNRRVEAVLTSTR
jgi:OOP family OmpA-OmpF porin